jgi:hypothetical protein
MLDTSTTVTPPLENWPDRSVRLRNGRTNDERCAEELRRDLDGFTVVEHLLAGNDPTLRSGIVFARDLWERNDVLLNRYQGWEVWRYRPAPGSNSGLPVLERLPERTR